MIYKQKMLSFLLVILFSTFNLAYAKPKEVDPKSYLKSGNGANTLYIENKGQIGDQDGKPNPAVKYLILRPGLNIQLKANSFSYDAYTIERFKRVEQLPEPVHHKFDRQNDDSLVYHFSRVDIELVEANPSPRITQEGASSDYLNYYTHIASQTNGEEGATGVRGYSTITFHDVYPNIDLEWFLDKDGKPEYQFIINPGGDPSRIRLRYHGAQKTELISDAIHIHINPGIIKEHIPISYLKESKEKVQISFIKLSNNEYGFEYPKYASNETLIIDPVPTLNWLTYFGGAGDEYMDELALSISSEIYYGGFTTSLTQIATTGSYQSQSNGNSDAYLTKFNMTGNRIWGTYFLTNFIDAINVDNIGNVFIAGSTDVKSGITTPGAFKVNYSNGSNMNMYIAKFTNSGNRDWATYFGNFRGGTITDIAVDVLNNIYFTGYTRSGDSIASNGAHQTILLDTNDAFLVKFSNSGTRLWGTYYGGSNDDRAYALCIDNDNNVLIGGSTQSPNNISTPGTHQSVYIGSTLWNIQGDAFIAKFNSNGTRLWGTYYGGSEGDQIRDIKSNSSGIFLVGNTLSTTGISTPNAIQSNLVGFQNGFISKMNNSGNRVWGTYFGNEALNHCLKIAVNLNSDVFVLGTSQSTTQLATPNAFQTINAGESDIYILKLRSDGSRDWSTYFGGNKWESVGGLAIDQNGTILIGGETASTTLPTTSGVHQTMYGGGSQDVFVARFTDYSIGLSILSNSYCQNQEFSLPYTVTGTYTAPNTFTAQLSNANGNFSNPTSLGTVSAIVSGTITCKIPIGTPAGTGYRIRIVSSNPSVTSSDNGSNITINPIPLPVITGDKSTCVSTQSVSYSVTQLPGHTYLWQSVSKGEIIGSATGNSVSVRWNATGTDTIKVRQTITATGCFKDTMFVVTIQGAPTPQITGSGSVCQSNTTLQSYSISQVNGDAYLWFPPIKGEIVGNVSGNSVQIKWTLSGTDTLRVRQTNGLTGCSKDTLLIVTINPVPSPLITGDKIVCAKISQYQYTVPLIAGHTYEWTTPTKGSIKGSRTNNAVTVTWNVSGNDTLKVRQTNTTTGCFKDTSIIVNVNELPAPTITGEQSICLSSSPSTFTVNQIPGYSIEWVKPRLGSIVSYKLNAVSIIWNASGTDSVRVKIKDNVSGCERDTILRVMIMKSPEPLITGDARACENQSPKVYRVQKQSGRTYSWSKPKNGIIVGSTTSDSISVQWVNSGSDTLRMEERDNATNCTKDTSFIVSIAPLPDATISGSNQVRENEQGITYSVKNESGLRYDWSIVSGDATIAGKTGNSITLNAGKPGTVILKVKITNQNGCMSESELSITVKSLTNIRESSSAPFTLYPNPAGDHLYVKMDAEITGDINIELYDVLGNRHFQQNYQTQPNTLEILIKDLIQGKYIIRVVASNAMFNLTFVKKN
jgi:hypothetical protein